jgi:tetratricopeptide (TPR) repeat protein
MPKRPRAHQLEDESKVAFRAALDPAWVVREKSHDYGVDLEVEVFDRDGTATGLIFNVQIKATDKSKIRTSVSVESAHLKYLNSLTLPTLLVRYNSIDKRSLYQWNFCLKPNEEQLENTSIKIEFNESQVVTPENCEEIKDTLYQLNCWRGATTHSRVHLESIASSIDPDFQFEVAKVVSLLVSELPNVFSPVRNQHVLRIQIIETDSWVSISAGQLASYSFERGHLASHSVRELISYAVLAIFGMLSYEYQAVELAKLLIDEKIKIAAKGIILHAIYGLSSNLDVAVQMALLCDLHKSVDETSSEFHTWLLASSTSVSKVRPMMQFLNAKLEVAIEAGDAQRQAMTLYNIANQLSNLGAKRGAVRCFNAARKAMPEYLARDYFLRELGGALFMSKRFGCAARIYRAALVASENAKVRFGLADALLFSGDIEGSLDEFLELLDKQIPYGHAETRLKIMICRHLLEMHQALDVKTKSSAALYRLKEIELKVSEYPVEVWESILKIDALSEIANFNWALLKDREGKPESALPAFLISAFKQPNDLRAWASAVIIALKTFDDGLISDVVSTASRIGGDEVHAEARSIVKASGLGPDFLRQFDSLFASLRRTDLGQSDLTVRDGFSGNEIV